MYGATLTARHPDSVLATSLFATDLPGSPLDLVGERPVVGGPMSTCGYRTLTRTTPTCMA